MANDPKKVIGRGSATERNANSSNEFNFWLAPEVLANPFDIVEADQMEGTRTFGLVTNIKQITDAPVAIHEHDVHLLEKGTCDPLTPITFTRGLAFQSTFKPG